jgi:hypothetical protein
MTDTGVTDIGTLYLDEAFRSLRGLKRMADAAMAQLSDEQFFSVLDAESNSVAIIVKHMSGNMRSRFTDFLTTDGEKPDRKRDSEFITNADNRAGLSRAWEAGFQVVLDTVKSLSPQDLARTVTIRAEPHSVLQAINRQIGHTAQHVGQIVFLAKHWKGADWQTLSVPRGQSEQFNAKKVAEMSQK